MFNFLKPRLTIVTHSSKFHSDDIFAVATLLIILEKEGKTAKVVRSRDMEVIKKADYVVDVGFIYDPEKNLFDHHQVGGAGVRDNGVPYASFGLVWKKYGKVLSGSSEVAEKIDRILVQPVDAGDNGIQFFKTNIPNLYPYNLSSIKDAFLPTWKEDGGHIDKIFIKMVEFAKELLKRELVRAKHGLEAKNIIADIYKKTDDKRLVVFDRYYGASDYITEFAEPLFIVFPSDDRTWILQTVQDDPENFVDRKSLPESWAGKNGTEFEKVTGIKDVVFCHRNRFLAVAKTKEAILKLAEIALKN